MTNDPGKPYYWWPVGGEGIRTSTYDGNGQDDRRVENVGFEPEMLLIIRPDGNQLVWRTSVMGNEDYTFGSSSGSTDRIKSLDADGFRLGTNINVNEASDLPDPPITYHYVAFKASPNLQVGTYQGNGDDFRALPEPPDLPMPFDPSLVHVKRDGLSNAVWKITALSGDGSLAYLGNEWGEQQPHMIRSLTTAPGQFEVGWQWEVNLSPNTYYYFYFALKSTVP